MVFGLASSLLSIFDIYFVLVISIWKWSKSKKSAVKDHMLMCNQLFSFDDFKVLASSNSEFHLKIKESLLISRDQPILNKNEASLPLCLFD